MLNNVIEAKNLTKVFNTKKGEFLAVKDASFEIEEHGFTSLVGPSGCGKSTIIRMLNGITPITDGTVTLFGKDYDCNVKVRGDVLKNMGFVFQSPNLLPWLTVRKNMELPLKVFKLKEEKYNKNVDELLRVIEMQEYADMYPGDLSGGMRQRVGVMRAMVHNPQVLFMDEPYGLLDDHMREQLDLETMSIWDRTGKTIVFITHNITEAVLISSKVIVMGTDPGRILTKIDIDLPRPRTLDMVNDPKFIEYEETIRDYIGRLDLSKIK